MAIRQQAPVLLLLATLFPDIVCAAGFPDGHILAVGSNKIYTVDPDSGEVATLFAGIASPQDIVYNAVTDSAFVLISTYPDYVVLELSWEPTRGYSISTFLSGLKRSDALAVDSTGNLYFNQSDLFDRRVWQADPSGVVTAVSEVSNDFSFSVSRMTFDSNANRLLVADDFRRVTEVSLPSGEVSIFNAFLDSPSGIDVAANGTVYVMERVFGTPSEGRITKLSPTGSELEFIQQLWMHDTFFFDGDLVVDDQRGSVYVSTHDQTIHVLEADLTHREIVIDPSFSSVGALDLIDSNAPSSRTADLDSDGDVDGHDLLAWQRSELLLASGLADWKTNYGGASQLVANSILVPEPAASFLLLIGIIGTQFYSTARQLPFRVIL